MLCFGAKRQHEQVRSRKDKEFDFLMPSQKHILCNMEQLLPYVRANRHSGLIMVILLDQK